MLSTARRETCPICGLAIALHKGFEAALHYQQWLTQEEYRLWLGDPDASPSWH